MRDEARVTTSSSIRVLPESLVNKIAAGEVVERPASVVKELLENTVDAQAQRIEVRLERGGKRVIRVTDDGVGMTPDDLALAFKGHATSKLQSERDLAAVRTMGFRGEALSSIGAVSQARIVSRARGALPGAEISVAGGKIGPVRTCGAAEGTSVEVRNLFFNMPARRKFLRSDRTEQAYCMEAVTRVALARAHVAFKVTHDGRQALNLPAADSAAGRIEGLFGGRLGRALLPVEAESEVLRCYGFTSAPTQDRANAQMQYVFLNGRYIRDRTIFRALADAYRGLLMPRRFPLCCLFLEIDPGAVDVNVHPTKIEVRFRNPSAVYAQIRNGVERALRSAGPLVSPVDEPSRGRRPDRPSPAPVERPDPGHQREGIRKALSEFFASRPDVGVEGPTVPKGDVSMPPSTGALPLAPAQASPEAVSRSAAVSHRGEKPPVQARPRRNVAQFHNAYLVEETPDGLNIIDQHALHERILYHELQERRTGAPIARQRLLIPQTVALSPKDFDLMMELHDTLERFGIEVTEFGPNTVAIQALPQVLGRVKPAQFLRDLLDELHDQPSAAAQQPGSGPLAHEERTMRSIACKGAVKAGDRLAPERIEWLLDQRDRLALEPTCPHGRPIALFFSRRDLEKRFHRK